MSNPINEVAIARTTATIHVWNRVDDDYEDERKFCEAADLVEVRKHNHVLTPGRYVGIPQKEDDGVKFEEKITKLSAELVEQMEQGQAIDAQIRQNMRNLGFQV